MPTTQAQRNWYARPENREKLRASTRRWRAKPENRPTMQAAHRRRKYGMSQEDYDARLAAQAGGCAICGTHDPGRKDAVGFAVDHNHDTGEVRGLLCIKCNAGIGLLRDDPNLLLRAVGYLTGCKV